MIFLVGSWKGARKGGIKCHVLLKSGYFASNKLTKHVRSQGHAIQEL